MASAKRDRLIDTALELFNRDGYRATGIDKILAESGVAKMTLYNHFGSKDALILAALERREARWRDWFRHAVARRAETPHGRLLAVFDALEEWFARPDFQGCMFMRAASEYCDRDHPIHAVAAEHQRLLLAGLRDLAAGAGAARPAKLAREILLLVLGAIVATQVNGPVDAGKAAKKAAAVLIEEALAAPELGDAA
ncbi:MAG: TetR/AcrR family transcriptional regulator [Proteobacteria bacterium]|nr:TetR/AcrR family transcriptional regulator [Pseudomonadota bacterium]